MPKKSLNWSLKPLTMATFLLSITLGLTACGSDDDEASSTGYFQLYNASANAPEIYLTVTDVDDEDESQTYSNVEFGDASSYISYSGDSYDIDLSWQDDDDNLSSVYQAQTTLSNDNIQFIAITGDITTPEVLSYDIAINNPSAEEDIFTARFINLHSFDGGIDLYISEADESFNEAQLIGQYAYSELSDSVSYELENYVFYITAAGSTEVLYQSEAIPFPYTSQYVMVVRANDGPGDSPFTLDKISNSVAVANFPDEYSQAEVRIYNAITEHPLLENYQGNVDLTLTSLNETAQATNLALGDFTNTLILPFGDYSISLTSPDNQQDIVNSHLLTLNPYDDKTVFFYLDEELEENDDGDEETNVYIRSLVVENSSRDSIYDHQVNVINLVDDFSIVSTYFVRSNETIDNAMYSQSNQYSQAKSISLFNNTYRVYAIAKDNSSEMILASQELILNEQSQEMFLMIEEDSSTITGYRMQFINQKN